MNKKDFNLLVKSVKQMKEIRKQQKKSLRKKRK